jgi:hypothetical protein
MLRYLIFFEVLCAVFDLSEYDFDLFMLPENDVADLCNFFKQFSCNVCLMPPIWQPAYVLQSLT